MKLLASGLAIAVMAAPAVAKEKRIDKSLQRLDPETRFEQICDVAAMNTIKREEKGYKPDRAVSSAVVDAVIREHTMQGAGGAFRSSGRWYQFSFTCTVTPDRMKVQSFSYKIGEPIPESKWEDYGLWR